MAEPAETVRAVIFDWGGVITNPLGETVGAWLEAEQIDKDSYVAAIRPWILQAYSPDGAESPVHALERGELSDADFEQVLAALLVRVDGTPVVAAGLLKRMLGESQAQPQMLDLIKDLRSRGLRTALLSNSWGGAPDGYPRHLFGDLFDAVVISGEVGMRKPEERIFRLALDLLALRPAQCVFVDDIEGNVAAARALGLAAVHHSDPATTAAELAALLAGSAPESASR